MSRDTRNFWAIVLSGVMLVSGCAPSRTYYFFEDGDLSHYKGVATELEVPDVDGCTLDEVRYATTPITLENYEKFTAEDFWDLSLEETVRIAMINSKVVRQVVVPRTTASVPIVGQSPENLLRGAGAAGDGIATVYDPAIQETNPTGGFGGVGVEAALSAFDAQLSSNILWSRTERPNNRVVDELIDQFQPLNTLQENATFQAQIAKTAASGGRFFARNNTIYTNSNTPTRAVPSDYYTDFELGVTQPLLQGNGVLFNRIAGPNSQPGLYNGVVIARINNDITLANFEISVHNLVRQIEDAYWELHFAYRALDADRRGRDALREYYETIAAKRRVGIQEGDEIPFSQVLSEYYQFEAQLKSTLRDLLTAENRLRYLMGLAASDGRLIRPTDTPTTAPYVLDWNEIHWEAQGRNVSLRAQRWEVKRREMELIASRNFLLPRLDAVALYRWLGQGDQLIDPNGRGVFPYEGSDAFATLTDGNYQEWELGFNFNMPLGFRRELAGVRNAQLQLARERAILQDQELEVSHLLAEAYRNLQSDHDLVRARFSAWMSAKRETFYVRTRIEVGQGVQPMEGRDLYRDLRDATRREAVAERDYYRAVINYNRSITEVHYRKGSLLEYNSIYLAESLWPGKAYYDAKERARERDAALFIDYGTTRPQVFSRGDVDQCFWGDRRDAAQLTPTPQPLFPEPQEQEPQSQPQQQEPLPTLPGERNDSPLDRQPPFPLPRDGNAAHLPGWPAQLAAGSERLSRHERPWTPEGRFRQAGAQRAVA